MTINGKNDNEMNITLSMEDMLIDGTYNNGTADV
jgi:hypothetical protein